MYTYVHTYILYMYGERERESRAQLGRLEESRVYARAR